MLGEFYKKCYFVTFYRSSTEILRHIENKCSASFLAYQNRVTDASGASTSL